MDVKSGLVVVISFSLLLFSFRLADEDVAMRLLLALLYTERDDLFVLLVHFL